MGSNALITVANLIEQFKYNGLPSKKRKTSGTTTTASTASPSFPQQGNDELQTLLMSPNNPRIRRKDVIINGPPDEFQAAPINDT